MTINMSGGVLVVSLGLAALCLASAADLSNGFNSNLPWQSPAALQVASMCSLPVAHPVQ